MHPSTFPSLSASLMRLCHRPMTPWKVSLQRTPLNFSGKFISRNGKKKQEGKVGKASKGKENLNYIPSARAVLQLFPFWPFDKDTYFLTFCEMRQEFNFVVQCKTQCGLDLQIEIPDESPRWTSTLSCRHFQLWNLLLFGTGSPKTFLQPYLALFLSFCKCFLTNWT